MNTEQLNSYSHFQLLKNSMPTVGLADIAGSCSSVSIPFSIQILLLLLRPLVSVAFRQENHQGKWKWTALDILLLNSS